MSAPAASRDSSQQEQPSGPPPAHQETDSPLEMIRWPVTTQRLSLRPANNDDLEATWKIRRLRDVGRWLTRPSAPISMATRLFLSLSTM